MTALRLLWTDRALRAMSIAVFLVGCIISTISPYQSLIAVTVFGLSEAAYAAVLFCGALTSIVTALTIGIVTDQKAKRRGAAVTSAAIGVAGAALVAGVQQPWAFVTAHVLFFPLTGALFGQIFGMVRLITQDRDSDDRDAILSAVRALFAVPFMVILPIWALAYAQGFPLPQVYAVLVVINAALLLCILRLWPRDGSGAWKDTASGLPLKEAFAEVLRPFVLIRVACVGAMMSGVSLYMVLLGLTFEAAPNRSTSDVALFAGGMAGLELPVMFSMALILRHIRRLHAIITGTLIYAGFLATYPWLANAPTIWLMMVPGALGGAILLTLPLAYLQDIMGSRAGVGGALLALQIVVSQGASALVFAVGTLLGGYTLVSAVGAAVMSLAALALWRLDRQNIIAKSNT